MMTRYAATILDMLSSVIIYSSYAIPCSLLPVMIQYTVTTLYTPVTIQHAVLHCITLDKIQYAVPHCKSPFEMMQYAIIILHICPHEIMLYNNYSTPLMMGSVTLSSSYIAS